MNRGFGRSGGGRFNRGGREEWQMKKRDEGGDLYPRKSFDKDRADRNPKASNSRNLINRQDPTEAMEADREKAKLAK